MIGYIKGTIEGIFQDSVLIENQGIGYKIFTSGRAIDKVTGTHQQVKFFTYLHVREDELSLFGFPTTEELDTFKLLIGVNGIGPKAKTFHIICIIRKRSFSGSCVTRCKSNFQGKRSWCKRCKQNHYGTER